MFVFLVKTPSRPTVGIAKASNLIIPGQSYSHASEEDSSSSSPPSGCAFGCLVLIGQSIVPKGSWFSLKLPRE